MTQKQATPWKIEGLVMSWRIACQLLPEQTERQKYSYCWNKVNSSLLGHAITVYKSQESSVQARKVLEDFFWTDVIIPLKQETVFPYLRKLELKIQTIWL